VTEHRREQGIFQAQASRTSVLYPMRVGFGSSVMMVALPVSIDQHTTLYVTVLEDSATSQRNGSATVTGHTASPDSKKGARSCLIFLDIRD